MPPKRKTPLGAIDANVVVTPQLYLTGKPSRPCTPVPIPFPVGMPIPNANENNPSQAVAPVFPSQQIPIKSTPVPLPTIPTAAMVAATVPATQSAPPASAPAPRKKARTPKAPAASAFDVTGVSLPGDTDGTVPVYDTCDTVRRKLRAHLKKPGVTQAGFLRAASAAAGVRVVSGSSLTSFLKLKGPLSGNSSGAYYVAYVFFEKLRVRDGKPKGKDRLVMEEVHRRGVERDRPMGNASFLCHESESPVIDKYGKITFQRRYY